MRTTREGPTQLVPAVGRLGEACYYDAADPFRYLSLAKQFSDAKHISLETYRKSGAGVRTTVWVVEDGGVLYIRTDPRSGKAKRVRNNPHVRVAVAEMGGTVRGDWEDGEAFQVDQKDSGRVRELFRKKYGVQMKLFGVLSRLPGGRRNDSLLLGIRLKDN